MKKIISALALASLLSGCGLVKREAGYPGGNLGFVADRASFFAAGQVETANRYLVGLALIVPLVDETVNTASEARLSAESVKVLYKNIARLEIAAKICALTTNGTTVESTCQGQNSNTGADSSFTFESISYEVVEALTDSLDQAYDNLGIDGGINNVTSLQPGDIFDAILEARDLVPVLLDYLATYRDVMIIVGASINYSCKLERRRANGRKITRIAAAKEADQKNGIAAPSKGDSENVAEAKAARDPLFNEDTEGQACNNLNSALSKLIARTRTPGFDIARNERPILDVRTASREVLNLGVRWELSPVYRNALLQHVNRSCRRLDALARTEASEDFKGCTVLLGGENEATAETVKENTTESVQQAVKELQSSETGN